MFITTVKVSPRYVLQEDGATETGYDDKNIYSQSLPVGLQLG